MQQDIAEVLIDRQTIAGRVQHLAEQITRDLTAKTGADKGLGPSDGIELTLVPILSGSFMFVADLIRYLPVRMRIRMLAVSSYADGATRSRGARLVKQLTNLPADLHGCHVLLIDDILDSGSTLRLAMELLEQRNPASLHTCVLLRKKRPEAMAVAVDYVAFDIPDQFIVGYGLDYDDYYRNLPDIVTLRPEVFREQ